MLEGNLPNAFRSDLRVLDLSGVVGRGRGLTGQVPPALHPLSELLILTLPNQQIHGEIPSFKSTLSLLALHNNRFKVLSDLKYADDASMTTILLHDNLLSCNVPLCGNASAKTSLVAIGNRLRYPNRKFPAWVHKYERDPLLWTSRADGMSLLLRISGATSFFILVVVSQLGLATPLRAMSEWQIGPETHLWVVKASSHLNTLYGDGFRSGSGLHCVPSVL